MRLFGELTELKDMQLRLAAGGAVLLNSSSSQSSGTQTFHLPDLPAAGTDSLVVLALAQTLSNKTLLDTTTTIGNTSDATKVLAFSTSGATTGTTLTLAAAQTGNHTLTLPNATDTLVGKATTDTLTNKILTGNTAANLISGSGTLTLNTSGTITVPNATDTLTANAATQTLTNKTLDTTNTVTLFDNKFTVENASDATKTLVFSLGGGTTGKTMTIASSPTNTRTLTLPDVTDTLTANTATQTLTNKTLSGNIAVTLISGSGTLTLNTAGTITLPSATDTLVGKATTDTLTNKTLTAPVQSSYEDFTEIATPATPSAGILRVYSKSGDGLYAKTSSGTEVQFQTAAASTATPTSQGIVTSYFPVIQSAIKSLSSAGYTITTTDGYEAVVVSTGASNQTITLPAASANTGRILWFKKTDSGAGKVIITRAGGDTIDGATTYNLTYQYDQASLVCDGTTWNVSVTPVAVPGTNSGLVSINGVLGSVTGSAVSSGYVGEVIRASQTSSQNAAASGSNRALESISLTAGNWLVSAAASCFRNSATFSGDLSISISTTSGAFGGTYTYDNIDTTPSNGLGGNGENGIWLNNVALRITSTTTVYLNVAATYSAGTPQWRGTIQGIRIS